MKTENARIQNIGLYYEGHFGNVYVKCVLDGRGWGAQIIIPMEKIRNFMGLFSGSYNLEDGIFLYELENAPVKVILNDSGEVVAIGDILSTEDEMVKLF